MTQPERTQAMGQLWFLSVVPLDQAPCHSVGQTVKPAHQASAHSPHAWKGQTSSDLGYHAVTREFG